MCTCRKTSLMNTTNPLASVDGFPALKTIIKAQIHPAPNKHKATSVFFFFFFLIKSIESQ